MIWEAIESSITIEDAIIDHVLERNYCKWLKMVELIT